MHRDPLQSVQCVTADEQYVYGGTSIHGGRGCVDVTSEGRLFLWDAAEQHRAFECIPVRGAVAVTSLAASKGLVIGSTASYDVANDATIFIFDLGQRQVTHNFQLRSPGTPLAGVPEAHGVIHLTTARDGDIYGVTKDDVFKIDLSTLRVVYLDPPPITDLYQIVEGVMWCCILVDRFLLTVALLSCRADELACVLL